MTQNPTLLAEKGQNSTEEERRREEVAGFVKVSGLGHVESAAADGGGGDDVDAAADDGKDGDDGGDAPEASSHCRTACSLGIRKQSEAHLQPLSVPA